MDYADLGPAMALSAGRDTFDRNVKLEATVKALCRQLEKLEDRVRELERKQNAVA